MGFSALSFFFKLESTCIGLHIKVELHLQSCEGCFDVAAALASAALQRLIPCLPSTVYEKCYIGWRFVPKKETPPLYTGHTQTRASGEPHTGPWVLKLLCIRTHPLRPGGKTTLNHHIRICKMYSSLMQSSRNTAGFPAYCKITLTLYEILKFVRHLNTKTAPVGLDRCLLQPIFQSWLLLPKLNPPCSQK